MIGLQGAHDLGDLRTGILCVLRLVEDERAEALLRERLSVETR